jgi:hypothetical protein
MRMRSRQQYRTMSRMQRRRSNMGIDDFGRQQQDEAAAPAEAAPAAGGDYTAELEKLAKLRDEGVITAEDFEAKKKQLLGV